MFIYNPDLTKLQKLIYQNTGIVYLDKPEEETEEFIRELQSITSSPIVDAYIFRETGFRDFTSEDWSKMYLQYLCTYSNPTKAALARWNELAAKPQDLEVLKLQVTEANKFTLEPEIKLLDYIVSIFESKIPLRDTQLKMIYCTPLNIMEAAYNKAKFGVKETNNIILTILFQEGGKDLVLFKSFDDIVRFIASNYSYNRDDYQPNEQTKLDKKILSKLDFNIPTSIKKVLLGSINKIKVNDKSTAELKKYQEFWKRIFQQLAYTSEKKMANRFPFAFEVKEKLYGKTIHTDNSDIEFFRKAGDLGTAFSIELGNPGQMIRRLLSYLRYTKNKVYAKKEIKNITKKRVRVEEDITELINDTMFDSALYRTSPKLLFKMLELLQNKEVYETRVKVSVYSNRVKVNYGVPLPGVNKQFAKIVIEKINKVLPVILKERNEKLGKVFLDFSNAKLPIQFSGRLESSDAMSCAYYPKGSVIDLKHIIYNKLKKDESITIDNIVLRAGLAWRGKRSTDLDLSTLLLKDNKPTDQLYYGRPVLNNSKGEVIGVSSGDITSCSETVFSAELIDFKYTDVIREGYVKLANVFNTYSGSRASDLETYFFIEVITDKEMIRSREYIRNYDLSKSVIAVRANSQERSFAGFAIDLLTDELSVLSTDIASSELNNILNRKLEKSIIETLDINVIYLNDMLPLMIEPEQLVTSIEDADTVITTNQYFEAEGKKIYNLATKAEECQELYM